MSRKKNIPYNSPEHRAALREIVHGTFVREGALVAFPLCFPDVTVPIPPDESRITALDLAADGNVYGGTSGRRTHLWVGMFHGATGMVYDLGAVAGADQCAAIACGAKDFIAAVNGPGGGRLIRRALEPLPFDLVQEWYFERQPFQDLGVVVPGERIVNAIINPGRDRLTGATDRHLFVLDLKSERAEIVADLQATGRLLGGVKGGILGLDTDQSLWRWDASAGRLERRICALPKGSWNGGAWTRDARNDTIFVADAQGVLFSFREDRGFSGPLGRTPLAPVGSLAVTRDGRLFGFCGEGIAQMFCFHPDSGRLDNLGCAVSVLQRRRYGYQFAAAVTGRDGEIYFGEDDNGGHLWLYFPRVEPQSC